MIGLYYLIGAGALLVLDSFFKQLAVKYLQPVTQIDLIPNVLSLYYHQNYGAGFGILQQKRIFLIVVTAVVLMVFVAAMLMGKLKGHLLLTAAAMIVGGGFGNLVDRICLGYVVDYVYFEPINFPIFNFADCCIVMGTVLFAIYILFIDGKQKETQDIPAPPVEGDAQ